MMKNRQHERHFRRASTLLEVGLPERLKMDHESVTISHEMARFGGEDIERTPYGRTFLASGRYRTTNSTFQGLP